MRNSLAVFFFSLFFYIQSPRAYRKISKGRIYRCHLKFQRSGIPEVPFLERLELGNIRFDCLQTIGASILYAKKDRPSEPAGGSNPLEFNLNFPNTLRMENQLMYMVAMCVQRDYFDARENTKLSRIQCKLYGCELDEREETSRFISNFRIYISLFTGARSLLLVLPFYSRALDSLVFALEHLGLPRRDEKNKGKAPDAVTMDKSKSTRGNRVSSPVYPTGCR